MLINRRFGSQSMKLGFVANVIIGILEIDKVGDIFLLHSGELEKTNH